MERNQKRCNKPSKDYGTGKNKVYQDNPGFKDPAAHDFRLALEAKLLKDLPGFQLIRVERIGLQKGS